MRADDWVDGKVKMVHSYNQVCLYENLKQNLLSKWVSHCMLVLKWYLLM